jgi:hypothetical protein
MKKKKQSRTPLWFADEIPGYQGDTNAPGLRKRLRRKDLAESFGVSIRTIDRWWKVTGFLPAPHFLEKHAVVLGASLPAYLAANTAYAFWSKSHSHVNSAMQLDVERDT